MKVWVKDFGIDMNVKNKGVELQINSPDGSEQIGDLIVTKTGLVWCAGKTKRQNGKLISWSDFAAYMRER